MDPEAPGVWRRRVPEECPQELCDLVSRCMAEEPCLRPNAKELHDCLKVSYHTFPQIPEVYSRSLVLYLCPALPREDSWSLRVSPGNVH